MSHRAPLKRAGEPASASPWGFAARGLAFALLLSALGLLGAPSFAAAAGDLTPSPTQLDFGSQDIHKGSTPIQQVTFTNSTGADMPVDSVNVIGPDAGAFSFDTNCSFVADGEFCQVNVSFDPSTTGAKTAEVELVDENGTVTIPLSGAGVTGTLSGSSPSFNQQPYYYGGQQQSADVTNNSSFSADGTTARITGPGAAFYSVAYSGCQFVIDPGNNCSIGVNFNPTGPGTKTAQLELSNDGTTDPLVIPLTATALAGPNAVISPSSYAFGDVAVGSSPPPKTFSLTNTGDFPLGVQQLFNVSGSAQLFPITNDACSGQVIAPGSSCHFTEGFHPAATRTYDATIFAITSQNQPVTTATISGAGVPVGFLPTFRGDGVGASVCRGVQAPARLKVAGRIVKLSHGRPTTPGSTFDLDAPGLGMQVLIDGQAVARGKGHVALTPRALMGVADGSRMLQVRARSAETDVHIALSPCSLVVSLDGGPQRATNVTVSASAGMRATFVQLPKALRLHVTRSTLGSASVRVGNQAAQTFSLFGARTRSNGITVRLRAHAIEVKHLPPEAGAVSIDLNPGVLTGHGGAVKARAILRGAAAPSRADAQTVWRR